MKRYWIVARHELITQLRRRSFVFFAFIFPFLMVGAEIGLGYMMARQAEETGTLGKIGYVDQAGILEPALEKPEEFQAYPDEPGAEAALAAGEIGAYFVIPPDYMLNGTVSAYTYQAIPDGIERQLRAFIRTNLLADRDPLEAERLQSPAEITMTTLDGSRTVDEKTGIALIFAPIVFVLVFAMSITMTSSFMMQNVAEEKETRMVELMMTSITPLEMLWGKILGLGALGLMQITVWAAAGGTIFVLSRNAGEMLAALGLPAWILVVGVLYLLLGFLLYGSLMSGIGASSSSAQEAQSISTIFSLLAMSPMFFFISYLRDPNGPIPVVLSLFPFTAPTAMMMRIALGQVPAWQIILSFLLLVGASALVVWLASWIFRVGLLMVGKRLKFRTLLQMIRQGSNRAFIPLQNSSSGPGG